MSRPERYYFQSKNRIGGTVEYILEPFFGIDARRIYGVCVADFYGGDDTVVSSVKAFRVLFECSVKEDGWLDKDDVLFIPSGLVRLLVPLSDIDFARMIALENAR